MTSMGNVASGGTGLFKICRTGGGFFRPVGGGSKTPAGPDARRRRPQGPPARKPRTITQAARRGPYQCSHKRRPQAAADARRLYQHKPRTPCHKRTQGPPGHISTRPEKASRLYRYKHKPPRIISTRHTSGRKARRGRLAALVYIHKGKPTSRPQAADAGRISFYPGMITSRRKASKLYRYQHKLRPIRSHKPPPKVFYIKSSFYYSYLL